MFAILNDVDLKDDSDDSNSAFSILNGVDLKTGGSDNSDPVLL